jgi:prophage maintenance system killer protein
VSVHYVDLVDYLALSAELTGLEAHTLQRVTKIELAESALHAPAAGIGETEFHPDFIDKAAVLLLRLAKNHPLPDGNKRAAWVSLRLFVERGGGWLWGAASGGSVCGFVGGGEGVASRHFAWRTPRARQPPPAWHPY